MPLNLMAIAEGSISRKGSTGASASKAAKPSTAAKKTVDEDTRAAMHKLEQLQVQNSTTKRAPAAAPPTPTPDLTDAAPPPPRAAAAASASAALVPRPLTNRERGALDLYVITPRAVPSVALLTEKYESITAFHEKGSRVEAFEKPIDGGLFGNQHGFECEDDCWVTTVKNDDPKRAGYLVTPCITYYHELRPLLDVFLSISGKTFHWCDGESSNAASTPSMTVTFAEDGSLVRPAPLPARCPCAAPRRDACRTNLTPRCRGCAENLRGGQRAVDVGGVWAELRRGALLCSGARADPLALPARVRVAQPRAGRWPRASPRLPQARVACVHR